MKIEVDIEEIKELILKEINYTLIESVLDEIVKNQNITQEITNKINNTILEYISSNEGKEYLIESFKRNMAVPWRKFEKHIDKAIND